MAIVSSPSSPRLWLLAAFTSLPPRSSWAAPLHLRVPVALPHLRDRYLSSASLFCTPAGSSSPPSSSPLLPRSFCSWGSGRSGWGAAWNRGGVAWCVSGALVAGSIVDSGSGGQGGCSGPSGSDWSSGFDGNSGSGCSPGSSCNSGSSDSGGCSCSGCRCGFGTESCCGAACG